MIILFEPGRAEDGDAWADEVESAEASDELEEDFNSGPEFLSTEAWAFEQRMLRAFGWGFAPQLLSLVIWICGNWCVGLVVHQGGV